MGCLEMLDVAEHLMGGAMLTFDERWCCCYADWCMYRVLPAGPRGPTGRNAPTTSWFCFTHEIIPVHWSQHFERISSPASGNRSTVKHGPLGALSLPQCYTLGVRSASRSGLTASQLAVEKNSGTSRVPGHERVQEIPSRHGEAVVF